MRSKFNQIEVVPPIKLTIPIKYSKIKWPEIPSKLSPSFERCEPIKYKLRRLDCIRENEKFLSSKKLIDINSIFHQRFKDAPEFEFRGMAKSVYDSNYKMKYIN